MRILFINQYGYDAPNTVNIDALANTLAGMGHHCALMLPANEPNRTPPHDILYDLLTYDFHACHLDEPSIQAIRTFNPDIVHPWVPRAIAGLAALEAAYIANCPLIVNHEDDERKLLGNAELNAAVRDLIPALEQNPPSDNLLKEFALNNDWFEWFHRMSIPFSYSVADPFLYALLHYRAAGFTAVWDQLTTKLHDTYHKPVLRVPPALDVQQIEYRPFNPDEQAACAQRFGLPTNTPILLFLGTIYNFTQDFEMLLHALGASACKSKPWHLVLVGRNQKPRETELLLKYHGLEDRFTDLGFQTGTDMNNLIRLADISLCPGLNNDWNRYRLPTKLAYYMAAGKAIMTYQIGFGESLANGKEVIITTTDNPYDWSHQLAELIDSTAMRATLGTAARAFAIQHFDVNGIAAELAEFYARILNDQAYPQRATVEDGVFQDPFEDAMSCLANVIQTHNMSRIVLYGAGKHTQRILTEIHSRMLKNAAIIAIVDDNATASDMAGIPIISPAQISTIETDALVISSDAFELDMFEHAIQWIPQDCALLCLYHPAMSILPDTLAQQNQTFNTKSVEIRKPYFLEGGCSAEP